MIFFVYIETIRFYAFLFVHNLGRQQTENQAASPRRLTPRNVVGNGREKIYWGYSCFVVSYSQFFRILENKLYCFIHLSLGAQEGYMDIFQQNHFYMSHNPADDISQRPTLGGPKWRPYSGAANRKSRAGGQRLIWCFGLLKSTAISFISQDTKNVVFRWVVLQPLSK